MKKIIRVEDARVHYKDQYFGSLTWTIMSVFDMREAGEYEITIEEGSKYTFYMLDYYMKFGNKKRYYYIGEREQEYDKFVSIVCRKAFDKIFFIPEKDKRYDITIKKVK